jgi:hypothetical protein
MSQNEVEESQTLDSASLRVTASCEEVVEAYRTGSLERAEAIDRLGTIIANAPGGIGGNPGALHANLAGIEEWDRERAEAAERGDARGQGPDGSRREGSGSPTREGETLHRDRINPTIRPQGMFSPPYGSRTPVAPKPD